MSSSQMPRDVEARIRALPGNNVCSDCSNVNPQWASVSYGSLMCLDCSGQHRSLGVHLSFVRSVQMDSWSAKQVAAMERSGGNTVLVDFFRAKGIEKNLRIATKYNTKQAAYYRDRLSRWLEGKTEPPPDPGRYDPATGGSEAQGAEPLPGETTDQYNDRQARLREEARERLRKKFGDGGMSGVGSSAGPGGGGGGEGLGGALGGAVGVVGGVVGGAVGFLRSNVLENDALHSTIRGTVGGLGELASGAVGSLRQTVAEGDMMGTLKRNAVLEEGSTVSKGLGWTVGTVGNLWDKGSQGISDFFGDEAGGGGAPTAPRCSEGHPLRAEPRSDAKCSLCRAPGTRYACSSGCSYDICTKCFERPAASAQAKGGKAAAGKKEAFNFDDDSWGTDDAPPPPDPTKEDMDRLAKEMGMKLTSVRGPSARPSPTPSENAREPSASPTPSRGSASPPVASPAASPPKPKAKAKASLTTADDFFSEFGI